MAAVMLAALPRASEAANQCHVVEVDYTTASSGQQVGDAPQVVVWLETAAGQYIGTLYVTQQIGTYGLGNRPGRFDFNTGPLWPYGRRITTFPVWAHRHGLSFPEIEFQSSPPDPATCFDDSDPTAYQTCGENELSHQFQQSSSDPHYCRPIQPAEPLWTTTVDTMSCATPSGAFTDKGKLAPVVTSLYPPRADLTTQQYDSASVATYKMLDPFDAVSQATPPPGTPTSIIWPIPSSFATGDYVIWVEVAKEIDDNATYNGTSYPSPPSSGPDQISYSDYGVAYRGQPSIVYSVPFTLGTAETSGLAAAYAGYGDPNGSDGNVRPPDATITTDTPGSGGSRLELIADANGMYRVRVDSRPESDDSPPAIPGSIEADAITASGATVTFTAPGDDGLIGTVSGYDVRIRAGDPITADNFDSSMPVAATIAPTVAGSIQTLQLANLLPETDYWVGIRAYDKCRNDSDLAIVPFTTAAPVGGEVDACFIATAAYGSMMANDVELLRRTRDVFLESTALGELAVEAYYTFGPAVAGVVGQSELLRAGARDALAPIVAWVRRLVY
jgi:hypothetical protein